MGAKVQIEPTRLCERCQNVVSQFIHGGIKGHARYWLPEFS